MEDKRLHKSPRYFNLVVLPALWCAVWGVFLASAWYRAQYVQTTFGWITGDLTGFLLPVYQHDAVVMAALLLLASAYSAASRFKPLGYCALASFFIVLVIYVADVASFTAFGTRLALEDTLFYGQEFGAGWSLLKLRLSTAFSTLSVPGFLSAALAMIAATFAAKKISGRIQTLVALVGIVGLTTFWALPLQSSYVHSWCYENVFEFNLGRGVNNAYSQPFIADLDKGYEKTFVEIEGMGKSPDIILLILESLSLHHSKLYSGIADYVPNFDNIARQNTYFRNFYANGWTTEDGLVALMTGEDPVPPVGSFDPKTLGQTPGAMEAFPFTSSIPNALRENGYSSYFLTSGDLSFSNKAKWLEKIGFGFFEGREAVEYAGAPKMHFDAAPDAYLYSRVLSGIKTDTFKSPYFMAIETVSSHLPYVHPQRKDNTEGGVMKYVDAQLGEFYLRLESSGFFDKGGMLIIMSDHRTMTPIPEDEIKQYGKSAGALVPAAIVYKGGSLPPTIDSPFQQADLLGSLKALTTEGPVKIADDRGVFFPENLRVAPYIVHVSGGDRDIVRVFDTDNVNKDIAIKLDGDDTRFVTGGIANGKRLIDKINFNRVDANRVGN